MIYHFFVSQNDQSYYPEVACGVACMHMLLKYHGLLDDISFGELANKLRLTVPPVKKGYKDTDAAIGVYPEDVYKYLFERDILFRSSFFKDDWTECLPDGPIMALMAGDEELFGEEGHWVVIVEKSEDSFTFLDPWYTYESKDYVKQMDEREFYHYYTGSACQIRQ